MIGLVKSILKESEIDPPYTVHSVHCTDTIRGLHVYLCPYLRHIFTIHIVTTILIHKRWHMQGLKSINRSLATMEVPNE